MTTSRTFSDCCPVSLAFEPDGLEAPSAANVIVDVFSDVEVRVLTGPRLPPTPLPVTAIFSARIDGVEIGERAPKM